MMGQVIVFIKGSYRCVAAVIVFCLSWLNCHGENDVLVGVFRLKPCDDDSLYYSVSINEDAIDQMECDTLLVPSEVKDDNNVYRVKHIADIGFRKCSFFHHLIIDEGIETIGNNAFEMCTGMSSVSLPSTLSEIGESLFYGACALRQIEVSGSNPVFDSREQCNAIVLTSENAVVVGCAGTVLPSSVAQIHKKAFSGCFALESFCVPQWVRDIEEYAFEDCISLKEIRFPENGHLHVGESAFDGCASLSAFHLPKGDFSFFYNPFTNCENLTTFTVDPANGEWYSNDAQDALIYRDGEILFAGSKNTAIPDGVKRISSAAFSGCRFRTRIYIPASVECIDYGAFKGCSNLTSIEVDRSNKQYDSRENCNCIIESSTNKIICGSSLSTIPQSVEAIGEYAFYKMNTPCILRIPDNVKRIENFAFSCCDVLREVIVPKETKLSPNSFFSCARLRNARRDVPLH